ncbi:TonB-dependent receptor domain-containing protein [Roseateles sp.]|uniref:TonB-dependent receptor domain-containing protein n=1 Tax=Roseateles sp. TaxID=1971397 RepID=UPI003BA595C6
MTSPIRRSVRPSAFATSFAAAPFTLALIASLVQASVQAQTVQPPSKLDSVVVTATRSKLSLDRVLADVTVLTRVDIERQAFGGLANLLRTAACFDIVQNGGPGNQTSVFLRGANTQHTLVLVDGVRMDTQGGSGGASWENIPLAQIERIEVVRGAASAVYGSDAVAGVVQVFTRKGSGAPYLEFGAGIGSLGTVKADASVSGAQGALDYAFTMATEFSEGFNARPVAFNPRDPSYLADLDGWRSHSQSARLGYALNAQHRVQVLALGSQMNSGYDASAKPKPGVDDRNLRNSQALSANWSAQWSEALQSELSASQATDRYETRPSPYLTETQIRSYALNSSLKLGPGQLNMLLERREDKLINSSLMTGDEADRSQNAIGAAYLLSLGAWDGQAHIRRDDDSEFGGITTGTLATGYRLSNEWRVWASGGTAFRAPTLYQSFSQYGPMPGKPKLQAERGKNAEVGLEFKRGAHQFGLTVYDNKIDDLISWDKQFVANCPPSKNPQPWDGCYGNLAKVELKGVSLKGATELMGLRLSGNLDWQSPKDASTGLFLGRRAQKHGGLRIDKSLGDWALGGQVLAYGYRFDFNDNSSKLGGYALLNLDARYQVNKALALQLNLDNAFNKTYQTAGGYAQAPRTVFMSLRFTPAL